MSSGVYNSFIVYIIFEQVLPFLSRESYLYTESSRIIFFIIATGASVLKEVPLK
jgi:hypothetical protein